MSFIRIRHLTFAGTLFMLCCLGSSLFAHDALNQALFPIPDSLHDSSAYVQAQHFSHLGYVYSAEYPDSALLFFKQAELIAESAQDSVALMQVHFDIGHFLMSRGAFNQALQIMFAGEQLAMGLQDTNKYIFFQFWKSRIFNELGDHEQALEASLVALELHKDTSDLSWPLNYYGESLRAMGQWQAAVDTLLLAQRHFYNNRDEVGYTMCASKLARTYQQMGNVEKVREFGGTVERRWEKIGAFESYLTGTTALVEMHIELEELDSAELKAKAALKRVEGKRYYGSTIRLAQVLTSVYEQQGDFESALHYKEVIEELENEYELDKVKINLAVKDSEIKNERLQANNALLESEKKAQFFLSLGLLSVLILLLGVGIMLYRNNRKTRFFNLTLQRKNEHLDELNQEKDMLMQIVAHDLKSPLNQVKGLRELLTMVGDLNEEQIELLGKMDFVVDRGLGLIKNLLELFTLENGKMEMNPVAAELSSRLKRLVAEHQVQADKKGISLLFESPTQPISVTTDPGHYERIVDNLLSNAIKYSPKGKRVWVKIDQSGGQCVTAVRDEGPGISAEDQEMMFRKFQRLTARPTGGESSTGLGLAIVKAFANQMGGEIEVKSTLGEGSEFALVLPNA